MASANAGPPMWQAEADTDLTLSASPTTAVVQKALALAKRRYSTVVIIFPPPSLHWLGKQYGSCFTPQNDETCKEEPLSIFKIPIAQY